MEETATISLKRLKELELKEISLVESIKEYDKLESELKMYKFQVNLNSMAIEHLENIGSSGVFDILIDKVSMYRRWYEDYVVKYDNLLKKIHSQEYNLNKIKSLEELIALYNTNFNDLRNRLKILNDKYNKSNELNNYLLKKLNRNRFFIKLFKLK